MVRAYPAHGDGCERISKYFDSSKGKSSVFSDSEDSSESEDGDDEVQEMSEDDNDKDKDKSDDDDEEDDAVITADVADIDGKMAVDGECPFGDLSDMEGSVDEDNEKYRETIEIQEPEAPSKKRKAKKKQSTMIGLLKKQKLKQAYYHKEQVIKFRSTKEDESYAIEKMLRRCRSYKRKDAKTRIKQDQRESAKMKKERKEQDTPKGILPRIIADRLERLHKGRSEDLKEAFDLKKSLLKSTLWQSLFRTQTEHLEQTLQFRREEIKRMIEPLIADADVRDRRATSKPSGSSGSSGSSGLAQRLENGGGPEKTRTYDSLSNAQDDKAVKKSLLKDIFATPVFRVRRLLQTYLPDKHPAIDKIVQLMSDYTAYSSSVYMRIGILDRRNASYVTQACDATRRLHKLKHHMQGVMPEDEGVLIVLKAEMHIEFNAKLHEKKQIPVKVVKHSEKRMVDLLYSLGWRHEVALLQRKLAFIVYLNSNRCEGWQADVETQCNSFDQWTLSVSPGVMEALPVSMMQILVPFNNWKRTILRQMSMLDSVAHETTWLATLKTKITGEIQSKCLYVYDKEANTILTESVPYVFSYLDARVDDHARLVVREWTADSSIDKPKDISRLVKEWPPNTKEDIDALDALCETVEKAGDAAQDSNVKAIKKYIQKTKERVQRAAKPAPKPVQGPQGVSAVSSDKTNALSTKKDVINLYIANEVGKYRSWDFSPVLRWIKSRNVETCEACNVARTYDFKEGAMICPTCGDSIVFIDDNIKGVSGQTMLNTADQFSLRGVKYQRKNHLSEVLNAIEGTIDTEIPEKVLSDVKKCIEKLRYTVEDLSDENNGIKKIREAMKDCKLRKYFEYEYIIRKLIYNIDPPKVGDYEKCVIRVIFDEAQSVFSETVKELELDRKSFLNYGYFLHQVARLHEFDHLLPYFRLPIQKVTLEISDKIWKNMCEKMGLAFLPTV